MSVTKNSLPSTNGRKRPQLTDSISRLDSILDGLADAIPATVADSVREALATAVRDSVLTALSEAFNNPDVLAALAARLPVQQPPATQPESKPTPSEPTPATTKPGQLRTWLTSLRTGWDKAVAWTGDKVREGRAWCGQQATHLRGWLAFAWTLRNPIGIGVASGVAVALLAYLAGPTLASVMSGLLASALTTASVLLAPILRMLAAGSRNV